MEKCSCLMLGSRGTCILWPATLEIPVNLWDIGKTVVQIKFTDFVGDIGG